MCGICGIISTQPSPTATLSVRNMNQALAHRGPDSEGYFNDNFAALAHKRLSIIDLSPSGAQPMKSNCGRYVMVYNGEIYNYAELKLQLNEYEFVGSSDSEVVLAAYMAWGEKCVEKFNGMFALLIWDSIEKKAFIARDRLGIKPLYYTQTDGHFIFASELRAVLKSLSVKPELDPVALHDYVRYQTVHAPRTIIKNVFVFPAGCTAYLKDNKILIKQFWDLHSFSIQTHSHTYEQIIQTIRQLFTSSIKYRLIADVPVGVFLSGGIDSSLITAIAAQNSASKINTFTVIFDEKEYTERQYAQIVAQKYHTHHTEIKILTTDLLDTMHQALNAADVPTGDGQNSYIISKAIANQGIKVALTGLGGDELFAGYDIFKRLLRLKQINKTTAIPLIIRKNIARIIDYAKHDIASSKLNELLSLPQWTLPEVYPLSRSMFTENRISKLFNHHPLSKNTVKQIVENFADINISNISKAELSTYLPNVLLRDTDNMSMAHGVELRVPFLDYRLVEYILSLNDSVKYPITPKKLLTDSFADCLPPEIVLRKKMGFTLPWKYWIKNELNEFCHQKMRNLSQRTYFNSEAIMQIWIDFEHNTPNVNWARVWYLVALEHWIERTE